MDNVILLISLLIGTIAGVLSILADSEQLIHVWSAWRRRHADIKRSRATTPVPVSTIVSTESSAVEGNSGPPEPGDQQVLRHEGEQETLPR